MAAGSAGRLALSLSTSASNQSGEKHAQEQPRADDGFTNFRDRDLGHMHIASVNGNTWVGMSMVLVIFALPLTFGSIPCLRSY